MSYLPSWDRVTGCNRLKAKINKYIEKNTHRVKNLTIAT